MYQNHEEDSSSPPLTPAEMAGPDLWQAFNKVLSPHKRSIILQTNSISSDLAQTETWPKSLLALHNLHSLPSTIYELIEFTDFELKMAQQLAKAPTEASKIFFGLFLCANRKHSSPRFSILYETLRREVGQDREKIVELALSMKSIADTSGKLVIDDIIYSLNF